MEAAHGTTTQSGSLAAQGHALLDFLRGELSPFPGRALATGRITLACVAVAVVCMVLRVPEAHLAVWIVFKVALEESGETLLTGIIGLAAITLALALALALLFVALDQPALRVCLIGAMAMLGFFLRRAMAIGVVGFVIGLVSTLVLTAPDFLPRPELMVRFVPWLWPVFALGIAGAVAANLWIAANDPAALLRAELARRLASTEEGIKRRQEGMAPDPELARFAALGTARLFGLVRSAEIIHPSLRARHREQLARIALVDRLVTAAAALEALPGELGPAELSQLGSVLAVCRRVRTSLQDTPEAAAPGTQMPSFNAPGEDSALLPVVVELERAAIRLEGLFRPGAQVDDADVPEAEPDGFFIADAFTNPAYATY